MLDFESSDSANQAQGARQTRRGAVGLRDDDLPKTPAFLKKATGRQKTQEAEVPTRPVAAAATKTIDEPSQSSRAGSKKRKSIETPEASGDEPEEEQEERASKKSARTTRNVDVEPAPIETTAHEGAQGSKRGTKTPEKAQVEEKAKAHYPTIAFQSNLSREGRTHAELLGLLTREVCSHEVQGLEDYFNKSFPDMSHRDIFIHLKNFLDELPPLVEQSCPEGAKFKPELRRSEKAAAASKTSTGGSKAQMEALRAQREELKKCAADVGAFLDGLGVGKTGAKGGKKAGSKNDLKTVRKLIPILYIPLLYRANYPYYIKYLSISLDRWVGL